MAFRNSLAVRMWQKGRQKAAQLISFRRGNIWDTLFRGLVILLFVVVLVTAIDNGRRSTVEDVVQQNVLQEDDVRRIVLQEVAALRGEMLSLIEELEATVPATAVNPPAQSRPEPSESRPEESAQAAASSDEPLTVSFQRILWPVQGEIVSDYGWQRHPVHQDWRFQGSIGIQADGSRNVRTVLPGRISEIGPDENGFRIVIEHGSGWYSVYRNVETAENLRVGQMLEQNVPIGSAGEDGLVYYSLLFEGEPVDPTAFFR